MKLIAKAMGRKLPSYISLAWAELLDTRGALFPLLHALYAGFITLRPNSRVTYGHIRDEMGNLILQ